MFCIENNEKNKSAVILNPERSEWVSRSHVTSVVSVVNDGAKTKRYSAKRDLYGPSLRSTLKMTAFAFLLALNISTSWADSCTCEWSGADNKTLTITNCSNGALSASACSDQKTANNVVVGTGVTSIGVSAFQNASSLKSITIPDSVTKIGDQAFWGATGLTSITIPDSVTKIGGYAFYGASGLTSITIPDNINTARWHTDAFDGLPASTNIVCQGGLNTCYEKLAKYFTSETCPQNLKDEGKGSLCNCSGSDCISPSRISQPSNTSQTGGSGGNQSEEAGSGEFSEADCYNKGQVPYDNQCWDEYPFAKKRWTPAEAAQWLHDGNDNFVIITFKK